jgi:hypothetical protein
MSHRVTRVRSDRLLELLHDKGFWLAFEANSHIPSGARYMHFARRGLLRGCFEVISIVRRAETLTAAAVVRTVPGRCAWKGMFKRQAIDECGMKVRNKADLIRWEESISSIGPVRCRQLAEREGQNVLESSARGRRAAGYYLSFVPRTVGDLASYWQKLKASASTEQREQAKFSLRMSMLIYESDDQEQMDMAYHAYQVATYLITLHANEGTKRGFFASGTDPDAEQDLAICFQVMASCLIGEPGFEHIVFD